MIESKTVFIVGAGASAEADLPVGSALADDISQALERKEDSENPNPAFHNQEFTHAFRRMYGQDESYASAAETIHRGIRYSRSIDEFLGSYNDIPEVSAVGKLAIAAVLLYKESQSKLAITQIRDRQWVNPARLKETWYLGLLRCLTSEVVASYDTAESSLKNVTFISFNYDRCVEQALTYGLADRLRLKLEKSAELVRRLRILHPYGCLGPLGVPSRSGGVPFGAFQSSQLGEIAENIKTFNEEFSESHLERQQILSAVKEADKIIFLGFAFHEPNIRLMTPPGGIGEKSMLATVHEVPPEERGNVVKQLRSLCYGNSDDSRASWMPTLVSKECNGFFKEYFRTIKS